MLAEATLPTVRYEVPIATSRVSTPQSTVSMPKFMSDAELKPAPVAPAMERETPKVANPEPELRPVPASVFDDDFFQVSPQRVSPSHSPDESVRVEAGLRETAYFEATESVQLTDSGADSIVRGPFGGPVADAAEPDELDIPAFLRRGH